MIWLWNFSDAFTGQLGGKSKVMRSKLLDTKAGQRV